MRKALILTRNFPPLLTSGSSRAWKIASNLVTIGWDPVVVAPPAVAAMESTLPSGSNPVTAIHRTGPDISLEKLEPADRCALLHGQNVSVPRPFSARLTSLFRDKSEGEAWSRNASVLVEHLLAEQPDIELLYAQGPPLEPLVLALETAKKHSLTVVLDIIAPLDPAMPAPGAPATSSEAKAEEHILLSGVPMITTTRTLKEYFLKKYFGRLDHGAITIVPDAFDATHPAFRPQVQKRSGMSMRIALMVGEVRKADLKAFVAGLEAWVRADRVGSGEVEIAVFGEGAPELEARAAKSPARTLLSFDFEAGIGKELEHCRNADLFCMLFGSSASNTCTIPDRLVDALGMGRPLGAILPNGVAARLVTDAGGHVAPAGDADAIGGLFRTVYQAWRSRSLQLASQEYVGLHAIGSVIHELTRAIAVQHVR